jgi:hypothetical protein
MLFQQRLDMPLALSTLAGSTQVQITLASATEDQFAGALLQTTDDAGEGISVSDQEQQCHGCQQQR